MIILSFLIKCHDFLILMAFNFLVSCTIKLDPWRQGYKPVTIVTEKSLNTIPEWIYCLFRLHTGVGNTYSNITEENLKFYIPVFSNYTDKNHFEECSKLVSGKTLQHLLLIKKRFPDREKFGCYILVLITIMFFWYLLPYNQCLDANNDMEYDTVHLISVSANQRERPSQKQKKEFTIKRKWNGSLGSQVFPFPDIFLTHS